MMDFFRSLRLGEKVDPRRNVEIIWFYMFVGALLTYLYLLSDFVNSKPSIGSIEILDPEFSKLLFAGQNMEIIVENMGWTEGPLWIQDDSASLSYLMFSDTKHNRIYRWEEGKGMFTVGKTIYVERSGCSTNSTYCENLYEPGSNGLLRVDEAKLDIVVCQHGERALGLLREDGERSVVASHYKGQRLNSPNDAIVSPDGHLYFTDPHFGLMDKAGKRIGETIEEVKEVEEVAEVAVDADGETTGTTTGTGTEAADEEAEEEARAGRNLGFSGLYFIHSAHLKQSIEDGVPTNTSILLDAAMSVPNGLAFSPDYSKCYVSNSDPAQPYIKVFDVADSGALVKGRLFYNMSDAYAARAAELGIAGAELLTANAGLPDGIKVDIYGNLFATGPGGVLVLSPAGVLLGRLRLPRPVSNLAFGADGRLYLTAGDVVARVWIKTKPTRFISKVYSAKKQAFSW